MTAGVVQRARVRIPVLVYHHVGPIRPATLPALTVTPDRFEAQVKWLRHRGFTSITPSLYSDWLQGPCDLPAKPVMITFDDGYEDNCEHAYPVLRRHGLGAVVFIVSGQIGGTNVWDQQQAPGMHRLMSAEQIRYWTGEGIEFGAHTRNHVDVSRVTPHERWTELIGSRDDLQNLLGKPVCSFAYPYGFHDRASAEDVRKVFSLGFTIDAGVNDERTDPCLLRRTVVHRRDITLDIAFRLRYGWSPIEECRHAAWLTAAALRR
jgi:peptidoglycan/xylan/chitin deacetylase (PgdA/CDA1 family)